MRRLLLAAVASVLITPVMMANAESPYNRYPHSGYPHVTYPHGGYPHGAYPHGGYPHGGYPHVGYAQGGGYHGGGGGGSGGGAGAGILGGILGGIAGGAIVNMLNPPAPAPVVVAPAPVYPAPVYRAPVIVADPTVVQIQRRLQELGLLPVSASIDGIYGPQTRDAVELWQSNSHLPVSGVVSPGELPILLGAQPAPPPPATGSLQPLLLAFTNQQVVAQWSGQGPMTTTPFHVNGSWALQWNSDGGFTAMLEKNGQDQGAIAQANTGGENSSSVSVGGDYYLRLDGPERWIARVVSMAPAIQQNPAAAQPIPTAPGPQPQPVPYPIRQTTPAQPQPAPYPIQQTTPSQPAPSPNQQAMPQPITQTTPPTPAPQPQPAPPQYPGWSGDIQKAADGSVHACSLEVDYGHQGVVDGNIKFALDTEMQGTLSLGRSAWKLPAGDLRITATFDRDPDEPLQLPASSGDDTPVLAALSDPNPEHTAKIRFHIDDALVLLMRVSKSVRISIPQQQPWKIATDTFYGALRAVQDCAMRHALPAVVEGQGVFSLTAPDACPTDPADRVGWCLDPNPGRAGVIGYTSSQLRRFPGVDSPLIRGTGKKPLATPDLEKLAAMSSYIVVAKNPDAKDASLGSGVAVGRHTIATNCHVVMWKSEAPPMGEAQAPAAAPPRAAPPAASPSSDTVDTPMSAPTAAAGTPAPDGSPGSSARGASERDAPFDTVYQKIVVRAQTGDGTLWPADVIAKACQYDIALLKTPADLVPVVAIRPFSDLTRGEPAYALGAPLGLAETFTPGVVSNLVPHMKLDHVQMTDVEVVMSSASITHGNSGGGLYDQYGDLIGLTESFLTEYPNLSLSIPISELVRPAAQ